MHNYRAVPIIVVACISALVSAGDATADVITTVRTAAKTLAGGDKSVGLDTGFVFTGEYDLGFGAGLRFNQTFYHPFIDRPFLTSSPTLQFWGASNDSVDVSVVGIIESISHRVPLPNRISLFAGLTGGYYYINKKMVERIDGVLTERNINSNSFEIFLTLGVEYEFPRYSSAFLQMKYGETYFSREVHLLAGLNFRKWKRDED
ncbi:MAG: hypothetical protein J7M24_01315 [Candidatus Latescibacteria bacterium]|nr:hypothetical protein [Candidatus Latescibacterota bacterium]